jgi:membrane protease YdiL (CAAX protease family)
VNALVADRRPTLLEGIVVLALGFRGLWYLWKYLPQGVHALNYAWVLHVWMALVPVAWCLLFRRRLPFALGNLRAFMGPALLTLCVSIVGQFVLYKMVGHAQLAEVFPSDPSSLLFQAIAPGLGEETLFRGFFQTSLNRTLPGLGTVITAVVFGLAHLTNGFPLPLLLTVGGITVLIGYGLGIAYERSENLVATIVAHNVLNLVNCGIAALLP